MLHNKTSNKIYLFNLKDTVLSLRTSAGKNHPNAFIHPTTGNKSQQRLNVINSSLVMLGVLVNNGIVILRSVAA